MRDLLALFAVVGLGALLPAAVGIAPATQEHWLAGILNLEWGRLAPVTLVGPLLGLFLLPFSVALLYRPATSGSVRIAWVAPVGLAAIAFVASALRFSSTGSIFPGNVFTPEGFGLTLGGIKPPVFPSLVFALWTLGVLATIYVLLVHRRALWVSRQLPVAQLFVVIAAVSQFAFLFLLHRQIYDRYFLPVVALLIPLVAAWASHTTRPRLAAGWAMVVLAVGVGAYLVGEQDYAAWQSARDQVARAAYRLAPANDVNAGYEANGTYVVIPTYGSSGVMLENLAVSDQPAGFGSLGPAHPRIVLRFASPGDPRPGVNYQSLNPGRIVMEVPQ